MTLPKPLQDKSPFFSFRNPLLWAFILSALYWLYLFFTAQMVIACDAEGYQLFGKLIYKDGWLKYFQTGPNREPFYLFIISISMHIADFCSVSYQTIQKITQILILFSTQILTFIVLKKFKINKFIAALTILYLGISPALVNSAFSLYSEIAVPPLVLMIILLNYYIWKNLSISGYNRMGLMAFLWGLLFIVITLTKAVFEIVTLIFLVPYVLFAVYSLIKRDKTSFNNSIIFILIGFLTFSGGITAYKHLNKKYNGKFTITDRGAWALYGNTARRMEKLSAKQWLAALAYAPGEGVCKMLCEEEDCYFWSFYKSDEFGYSKATELNNSGLPRDKIDPTLIKISMEKILQNPLQYILLMGIEASKMYFWESTQIGFVRYPSWLTKLYNITLFKNGLRLFIALLTIVSFFIAVKFIIHNRRNIRRTKTPTDDTTIIMFFILLFLITYIGLHSFFFILTRYAIPIAPLYLILIAFSANRILTSNNN